MPLPQHLLLSAMLASTAATAACNATAAPAPDSTLSGPPEELPRWMLPIVRSQMAGLGGQVKELRWAAGSLEFERAAELARTVAAASHIGRPLDAQATAASVIPAHYLTLQTEMRERAQRLAAVAATEDRRALSMAYGALVDTCTPCHALYRVAAQPLEIPSLAQR
jgi:hypothetical protein